MFRQAIAIARDFTLPVIMSRKPVEGRCEASIASAVVVNDEGWVVTAGHVLEIFAAMAEDEKKTRQAEIAIANAQSAATNRHEKRRLERAGPKINKAATDRYSFALGNLPVGVRMVDPQIVIPAADLGLARLEPFDPAWIPRYPVFKDPSKGVEPGVSLCKLGFPFHAVEPTWNAALGAFELPQDLQLALFPMDGILTRHVLVSLPDGAPKPPFQLQFLETSTPGLKGQSGGPTFDVNGTIWAIQSSTAHLHLGFAPSVPGGKNGEKEHQFLNVGYGVHLIPFHQPLTILA